MDKHNNKHPISDKDKVKQLSTIFKWGEFSPLSEDRSVEDLMFLKQKMEQTEEDYDQ